MKGLSLESAKKGFPTIGKFIEEVFGEKENEIYEWLSKVKFTPRSEGRKVLIVTGDAASGKTSFLEIVNSLFAFDSVEVGQGELVSAFNVHWITKSMVCIDSARCQKLEFQELIKSLVNSVQTPVNEKYKDVFTIVPKVNFLLITNDLAGAESLVSNNEHAFIIQTTGKDITPASKKFRESRDKHYSLMAENELSKLTDYLYVKYQS